MANGVSSEMDDVVRLLHEIDGHLGLAIHRGEGKDERWIKEAEQYRSRLRSAIPRVENAGDDLKRSQAAYADLYDATRCPEPNCDGEKGHDGKHYAWVAD